MNVLTNAPSAEILVLKMHILTEAHLYRLLSLRLEIDEYQLPPMQFLTLAKLALGGTAYKDTLVKVLALNDLRNEFAHELDENRLEPAFEKFCAKTNMFWPPFDKANKPEQFAELRKGAIGAGALSCATEVYCWLTSVFARQYEAAGHDAGPLRAIVTESTRLLQSIRKEQNVTRRVYSSESEL